MTLYFLGSDSFWEVLVLSNQNTFCSRTHHLAPVFLETVDSVSVNQ